MLKKRSFWESLIIIVILFSIIEIFLEDLSIIRHWGVHARKILLITGFLFDLIFTIEFIIRSVLAGKNKGWVSYFRYEKGWVDFVCSIPLIVFNSGPIMLGMFFPGHIVALPFLGLLNILKITKILRIARVLRLLRILKIFMKASREESELRMKQVSLITSITVLTITFILIISPLFPGLFYSQDLNIDKQKDKYVSIIREWHLNLGLSDTDKVEKLEYLLKKDHNILYMYHMGETVINNIGMPGTTPAMIVPGKFLYTDFKVLNYLDFILWYSVKDVLIDNAKVNFLIEIIIIVLLAAFLAFYKPAVK